MENHPLINKGYRLLSQPLTIPRFLLYHLVGDLISSRRAGAVATLHQHRCGSSVVGKMLAKHPEISWRGETLTRNMLRWERKHGSRRGWTCDPARIIRKDMRQMPWGWFGCEVTAHNLNRLHLDCGQIIDTLCALGFSRFIVQERRNHLRRYISSRIGARSRSWENKKVKHKPTPIYLDPNAAGMDDESGRLIDRLRIDTESIQEMVRLTEEYNPLHLVYEDHIEQDPRVAYHMICEHLDLEPQEVTPKLVRENSFPVQDMLQNYDEVADVLRHTEFEWMLTA